IRDFHVTGVQTCALPISRGWVCVFPCPDDDPPPVRPGLAGVLPRAAAVASVASVASVAAYSAYAAHAAAPPVSNVIYKLLYVNYIFHHGGYILRAGGQAPGSGAAHTLPRAHGAGGPGGGRAGVHRHGRRPTWRAARSAKTPRRKNAPWK